MKIRYSTNRETAVILKEWRSNCGSALVGSHLSTGLKTSCQNGRERAVESYMTGTVEAPEFTAEAVLRQLGPHARHIRARTITRLAGTLKIEMA